MWNGRIRALKKLLFYKTNKEHLLKKRQQQPVFEYVNKADVSILLEKAMATHSSTLAWKIPWMEEPGRLQSMGSLRVRHD